MSYQVRSKTFSPIFPKFYSEQSRKIGWETEIRDHVSLFYNPESILAVLITCIYPLGGAGLMDMTRVIHAFLNSVKLSIACQTLLGSRGFLGFFGSQS